MQLHLASIYDSKISALKCTKLPSKSNIQQIFESTANARQALFYPPKMMEEKDNGIVSQQNNHAYHGVNNPMMQNIDAKCLLIESNDENSCNENSSNFFKGNFSDTSSNDQLLMEYTPNAPTLPSVSSQSFSSILLFKIDQCGRKCDMNDQKIVNQKRIFLDEIGDLFNHNDFQTVASVFPKEVNLKQKILSMIYINICSTKISHSSINSSYMISFMYSDKYEDKSLSQINKSVFSKQILKILNGMIKSLSISDLKILMKICADFLYDEYDQFFSFFANFIINHQNKSMDIFNMLCQLLCHYTKSSPYLKKTILPLLRILSDNLMVSNRITISKTILNIMIPLIKDRHFQIYSGEFIKLINLISEDFSNVYKFLLVYILKYYPQTNTKKQVILIKMMIKSLSSINTKDFSSNNYKLMNSFIKILANGIISPSSIVSLAAFQFFYERTVNTFISINKQLVFDSILPATLYSLKNHWSEKVRKDASFAISILKHSGANFENCMKIGGFLDSNPTANVQINMENKNQTFSMSLSTQNNDPTKAKRVPFTAMVMPNSDIAPPRGVLSKNQPPRVTFLNPKIPKSINNDLKNNMLPKRPSKVPCVHSLLPSNPASPSWISSSKKSIKASSSPLLTQLNDNNFNFFENSLNNNGNNESVNESENVVSISKMDAWVLITKWANVNDNSI